MLDLPRISEAEWEVMKVIWSKTEPCTAHDVVIALSDQMDWKPNTIKTLIARLVKKLVLAYHEEGKNYLYYPLVTEEECIRAESRSFLKRVYDGALKPMLVNFLQEEQLSSEEIEELKRILEERKK
jgi:BlaI family transcriptional regulator, penicillinase repressor